jgi:hypothetical protein
VKFVWFVLAVILLILIFHPPDAKNPPLENSNAHIDSLKTSKEIDKEFTHCIVSNAQYGSYSSYDGGKSAEALLEKECPFEYVEWVNSCEKDSGDDEKMCIVKAAILAQVTLKKFNK